MQQAVDAADIPAGVRVRALMGDAFAAAYKLYGLSEVAGRIYSALYFADSQLTLDELASAIGIGKTTASVNMRFLIGLGLAKRVWQPGRKEFYTAERDFGGAMLDHLRATFQKECAVMRKAVADAQKVLADAHPAAGGEERAALEGDKALLLKLNQVYHGWDLVLRVLGRLAPKSRRERAGDREGRERE